MFAVLTRWMLLTCLVFIATTASAEQFLNPESTVAPEKLAQIKSLIEKLNAPETAVREEAEKELLKIGVPALNLLKDAVKSDQPEVAARSKRLMGKITEQASRPSDSYASILPDNSIFFLEAPNARKTLEKLKASPLGKFWDLPSMQKFYTGHVDAQVPADQKLLSAIRELPKLADGKVLFAFGDPESCEAAELDPPLVYLMETQRPKELHTAVRSMFENDPPKANRRYGPFTIEEHTSAQSVFGETSMLHSLTAKGAESFLDYLVKRAKNPLSETLKDVTARIPNYDFVYYINNKEFQRLSDDGQLVDDDQIGSLNALGFFAGSVWQGVIEVTPDGFNEKFKVTIPEKVGEKKDKENEGLAGVFAKLAKEIPAAPKGDAPKALDMIPWQAGLVVAFNADVSKNHAALAKAIRDFDTHMAPLPRANRQQMQGQQPGVPQVQPGGQPGQAPPMPAPKGAPKDGGKAMTPGQRAMAEAGVNVPAAGKEGAPAGNAPGGANAPGGNNPPAADRAAAAAAELAALRAQKVPPHVTRFEKLGLKMEQFFEQVEGPVALSLFFQQIEGDEMPDTVPVSPLFAVVLKDPKQIEQALEAASAGAEPRFSKETLNGGTHYIENSGDPDSRPGFWLKDKYLTWSTERDLLDLAGAALAHRGGNERYTDRTNYKKAIAANQPDPTALLTFYGDAEQCFEMPYNLAKINWQEDEDNPWPQYAHIKPLLAGKEIYIEFKAGKDGLEGTAKTPFSLFGLIESTRRTLNEAGFW